MQKYPKWLTGPLQQPSWVTPASQLYDNASISLCFMAIYSWVSPTGVEGKHADVRSAQKRAPWEMSEIAKPCSALAMRPSIRGPTDTSPEASISFSNSEQHLT